MQFVEALKKPEETAQRIEEVMGQGHARFETQHRRKDGGILDVEISANYIDVGGGQFFVFIRDITERKRAEEVLKEYSERLEEMVEERTAELNERVAEVEQLNRGMVNLTEDLQVTNRSLEATAARLQEVNQELNDFAYVVSHDLKAPLRAISQLDLGRLCGASRRGWPGKAAFADRPHKTYAQPHRGHPPAL